MSCSTSSASTSDGVVTMSVTSFGPHWRLPPPTITIRTIPPRGSRYVALAIEPAQQDGDGARVVAELMAGARDDAHLRRAVGAGDHAGVEVGDEIVVGAVHDQQRSRRVLGDAVQRANGAQVLHPRVERRREARVGDETDLASVLEEAAGLAAPVVEVGGRAEHGHAPHPFVARAGTQAERAARAEPRHPHARHAVEAVDVVDGGGDVLEPAAEAELALGLARA